MTTNKQTKLVLPNFVSSSNYCMKISKCQESTEHGARSPEWYLSQNHNITSSHSAALACNSTCTFSTPAKAFPHELTQLLPTSISDQLWSYKPLHKNWLHTLLRSKICKNLDKPYTHQRHRLHCHHPNPKSMSQGSTAKRTSTWLRAARWTQSMASSLGQWCKVNWGWRCPRWGWTKDVGRQKGAPRFQGLDHALVGTVLLGRSSAWPFQDLPSTRPLFAPPRI
jgi:hypothetical protein